MSVGTEAIKSLEDRIQSGKEKYSQEIDINDDYDWAVEAREELLDGIQYLTAFLMLREQAIKKYMIMKNEYLNSPINTKPDKYEGLVGYSQALIDIGVKEEDLE